MATLIDESQSAFVANRQILDGVLIANESIRWLKKRKIPGTLIKLDFQKAYDSVNWNFLKQVMEKLGFGRRWIRWIMDCVSTASMSILLNGSPLKPFKMEKGLRQGDPLSPYLFLLVSETLVNFLRKAEERNLIEAVHIGKAKVNLKHLQFADDILIFVPRNTTCITNYFRILDVFALMSGLSLNYSKSCFISWNPSDHCWAEETAKNTGCLHSTCPFKYPGLPLGDHMKKNSAWKSVVEKIQKRLASWKSKILSRAGRNMLIKSVLNCLPVYYMSMFKMPKTIAHKIVQIQRRFCWGWANEASGEKMGCPTIKWANIELPKELGGLGVGNMMHKNLILLFKWWWRFSESDDCLWKKILMSVHEISGLKASSGTFSKVKEGMWAQLMSDEAKSSKIRSIVEEGMIIKLGNRTSVRFWHDRWCEVGILKTIFPRLYAISIQKNTFISHMGFWGEDAWIWNLEWRRTVYEWEEEEVSTLKHHIEQNCPNRGREDGAYWKQSSKVGYPVKSIVEKMNESSAPILPKPIISLVWKNILPPRAQMTLWMANLEKLKTGDFLEEKGIINSQQAICPFQGNQRIKFSRSVYLQILLEFLDENVRMVGHVRCSP